MIQKLDWSNANIFAYKASGQISRQDHENIYKELRNAIKEFGKIRLFMILPKFAWPAPNALGLRFSFAKDHFFDIERVAVVSNISIFSFFSFLFNLIPILRFRHYKIKDELLAKTWISTKHI